VSPSVSPPQPEHECPTPPLPTTCCIPPRTVPVDAAVHTAASWAPGSRGRCMREMLGWIRSADCVKG
jgi:hypothetical protein